MGQPYVVIPNDEKEKKNSAQKSWEIESPNRELQILAQAQQLESPGHLSVVSHWTFLWERNSCVFSLTHTHTQTLRKSAVSSWFAVGVGANTFFLDHRFHHHNSWTRRCSPGPFDYSFGYIEHFVDAFL
jgi:hypothetical protein